MRIGLNAMILSRRDSGVGIFIRGLIRALGTFDPGNEYVVYHGLDSGPIDAGTAGNIRLVRIRVHNRNRVHRIAWEQFYLPDALRVDRVDVFHAPAYIKPLAVTTPTVLTVHDLFALTHPEVCKRLNVLYFGLALRRSIRSATLVHCLSNAVRSEVARLLPECADKVRVAAPGVDDLFSKPVPPDAIAAVQARYGIGGEPPFLFVGNIEPKKNLSLVFDALKLIETRYGSRRPLVLVGQRGWRYRSTLAHYRSLGLGDRVAWCGYVDRAELPAFYSMALCLVFPSVCEGFGIPPLEAMSCGTPVILSDIPALTEVAGDAALFCSNTNPFDLAEKMRRIETDAEARASLAGSGRRRAGQFDWRRAAQEMAGIYREK